MNAPSDAYVVVSVVVPVLYLFGLMYGIPWVDGSYNVNSALSLLAMTIIPVLDAITDLLFMLMSNFASRVLMISMMVFYFLPMLYFFVWLHRHDALTPRLSLLVKSSQSFFAAEKNNIQSFFAALLLLILNVLDIVITLLWCGVGVFMYTFKIFIISAYQVRWLSIWSASNSEDEEFNGSKENAVEEEVVNVSLNTATIVDMSIFNESVYVGAIFGAIPQLIIQSISCQMTGEWTVISYMSIICSFMNIMYSVYLFITNFHLKDDDAIPKTKEEFKQGLENVLDEINTLSISKLKAKLHHLCIDQSVPEDKLSSQQNTASKTTKLPSKGDSTDNDKSKNNKTSKYKTTSKALDEFNGAPLSI